MHQTTRDAAREGLNAYNFRPLIRQRCQDHPIDECLSLLKAVQTWFSTGSSFHDLSIHRRTAVAGVGGEDRDLAGGAATGLGWFGPMRGTVDSINRVADNDDFLAMACDVIPPRGEVSLAGYDRPEARERALLY